MRRIGTVDDAANSDLLVTSRIWGSNIMVKCSALTRSVATRGRPNASGGSVLDPSHHFGQLAASFDPFGRRVGKTRAAPGPGSAGEAKSSSRPWGPEGSLIRPGGLTGPPGQPKPSGRIPNLGGRAQADGRFGRESDSHLAYQPSTGLTTGRDSDLHLVYTWPGFGSHRPARRSERGAHSSSQTPAARPP